jgi:hypothetical protein
VRGLEADGTPKAPAFMVRAKVVDEVPDLSRHQSLKKG